MADRSREEAAALPPCVRCGAPRTAHAPLYCTFCGARQATGVADPEAYRTLPERYQLVTKQPGYDVAHALRPRLPPVAHVSSAIAMVVLTTAFAYAFVAMSRVVKAGALFTWVGTGLGIVCAVIGIVGVGAALRRVLSPTVVEVAVITILGPDPRAGNDGYRIDLRGLHAVNRTGFASGELVGMVIDGDIGLAYTQADRLLDFRWFDVMPAPLPAGEPPRAPSCAACAAPMTFASKDVCLHCGAPLPEPDLGEHGATFAALAAAPAVRTALARRVRGGLPSLAGPLIVLGLGGALGWMLWNLRYAVAFFYDEVSPYAVLALLPLALLLSIGAIWLSRRMAPRLSPPIAVLGLVLRQRRVMTHTVNNRPVYRHHVTIAAANGSRRELRAMPEIAAAIRDCSVGVAHVRGAWLAGFDAS
jgi:hypothetical protein